MLLRGSRGMLTDFTERAILRLQIHTIVARSEFLELSHPGDGIMRERDGGSFVVVRHGWPRMETD